MGVEVASMGIERRLPEDEVVQFSEPKRGTYKKLIIRDGRLVGGILLDDISEAAYLIQAFDRSMPLPEEPLHLLFDIGDPPKQVTFAQMSAGTQVCNCNSVSKGAIIACVKSGKRNAKAVMDVTRAGMGCGSCKSMVSEIVEWACEGETEEDPSVHYYVPGVPLSKPELIRAVFERNPEVGIGCFRSSGWRKRGRGQQARSRVASQDALEGRIRRRERRALHQRAGSREYSERRHVFGPADARWHHQPRTTAAHRVRCREILRSTGQTDWWAAHRPAGHPEGRSAEGLARS
jgi:bacterioferritin-associated ferredoxin